MGIRLLIDGYNLMFQSVTTKQGLEGKNALRAARWRMLQMLLELIDEPMLDQTMIVFDANAAPPGLPDKYQHRGMQIVFARDWDSADELIQMEIRKHPTPKLLTVVSSDHAIHRKALARGATVLDSESWFDVQLHQREMREREASLHELHGIEQENDSKQRELTDQEKRSWLEEFGF
jgi:predicted RNA-binding protein with PIN domain